MMPVIQLRKEPTTDALTLAQPAPLSAAQRDVVAYRDGKPIARWPWFLSHKPTRRNKRVALNCALYPVEWVEDKTE